MARLILVFICWLAGWLGARAESREIVVAAYNLENYVGAPPAGEVSPRMARPKTESSIAALIAIIKELSPDILGVCEMGSPAQFEDFKQRLAQAGLGFTDFEYVAGPDEERHLALLSRLPIVAHHSLPDVSYELGGTPQKVKRGFLDVTVRVNPGYDLRLVGAHLKSKRPTPGGEELQRRHEAHCLRQHVDRILAAQPAANLLVYGDFNDLRNEAAIQEIAGARGGARFLTDLPLQDSVGDRWTHYWKEADLYSRFDYFFASPGLLREVVLPHSGIHRSNRWRLASDHRAIYVSIAPSDRVR